MHATLESVLAILTALSACLFLWQIAVAARFPLHRRNASPARFPGVTLLKPLKGADAKTEECLRSWLAQNYSGPIQALFGVADSDDPAGDIVRKLKAEYPNQDIELVHCPKRMGANAKVSTLVQLEPHVKHPVVIVSDADVWVPDDLLQQVVTVMEPEKAGLACCFYQIVTGESFAGRLEAFSVNADFWSQVLQSAAIKPMHFALGAVMATSRETLSRIGGFTPLLDYVADDYQLGNRVSQAGAAISLCPVVVQCRSSGANWGDVCRHQIRWARTIRVCQPAPFFFSILSNATLWPVLWLAVSPSLRVGIAVACIFLFRAFGGAWLEGRLTGSFRASSLILAIPSDVFRAIFWAMAFLGNRIYWGGRRFKVLRGGKLVPLK